MGWKRAAGVVLIAGATGGLLTQCKRTDADLLARTGDVIGRKVKAALPDASKVAAPFVAFKPGDALPVEEQVRLRIHSDKQMSGAKVSVAPGTTPGEVRLRGVVATGVQSARAEQLAMETVGVEKVVNELARPEK